MSPNKRKKTNNFDIRNDANYNLKITRQIDLVLRYLANEWCNLTSFKWNYNLKITRQIDMVLRYLANEWCDLTNFSSEITIR